MMAAERPGVQRAAGWNTLMDRKMFFLLLDAKSP
jgi:hypothetical protein